MPPTPPRDHLRLLIVLVPSLTMLSVGACSKGGRTGGGGSASKATTSQDFLANPSEAAKGWLPEAQEGSRFALDGAPKRYDKEGIFELLNGGADSLIEEGLVALWHVRLKDDAQVFSSAEIQLMDVGAPDKARAMLRKEKAPEAKPISLGDEGFTEKGSVLFAKGRHLVRVMALPSGDLRLAPVEDIARRIVATPHAAW